MKKIIVATGNQGKAREFRELLTPLGYEVLTLADFPNAEDVEETGSTFAENALLKANALSQVLGIPVLADDSGLIVDALDGRPGIYSARYAGEPKNDLKNYQKLLEELGDLPLEKRTARFYCVIAFVDPNGPQLTVDGSVEGKILFEPSGENGFGYDPVFWVNELGKSFATCSADEKNAVSHRGRALLKLVSQLTTVSHDGGA